MATEITMPKLSDTMTEGRLISWKKSVGEKVNRGDIIVFRYPLDIRDGIHFIRHQPLILSSMILDFFATFFASANTLLPWFSQNVLHVGEVAYGWLAAASSAGSVLVGLVVSQFNNVRRQGALLVGAVVVFGLATILFGMSRIYSMVFFALALSGAADSVSTIIRNTIRNLNTPDALRGRMTGINQIFFMGGPQLGEVEAGAAAMVGFGLSPAVILAAWVEAHLARATSRSG